jgi:tol-pal system protein YbgF
VRNFTLASGLLGLIGCSSLTPTSDPVYLRITDMEARLIRIERVLENESLISLAQDISSLRTEVQTLLNEVETLSYEMDSQSQRQRDLYVDLDQRLAAIEANQTRIASMGTSASSVGGAVSDLQAYDQAFARIQQQDWNGAVDAFTSFLATYPVSGRRSNAQYWLGEAYYAQLDFPTALVEFQRVIDNYPQSDKMAAALLKSGFSHYNLGNMERARQSLLRVVREFAGTMEADQAEQRLQRIATEGG